EKAAVKVKAKPPVAQPRPTLPRPTAENPIRKASNRCVSADPGAALVCADASLSAAERQLNRAYRQAEAAGVSSARLARQQQRWIEARAQAAKEAPWAVRDVYEARIAELNDMTRSAGGDY
uniref:lysozyme inhibitor LprI family protein n=1 Tax=Phenylobacterium sp. TaxID=1871053 RepID=UPI003784CDF1